MGDGLAVGADGEAEAGELLVEVVGAVPVLGLALDVPAVVAFEDADLAVAARQDVSEAALVFAEIGDDGLLLEAEAAGTRDGFSEVGLEANEAGLVGEVAQRLVAAAVEFDVVGAERERTEQAVAERSDAAGGAAQALSGFGETAGCGREVEHVELVVLDSSFFRLHKNPPLICKRMWQWEVRCRERSLTIAKNVRNWFAR